MGWITSALMAVAAVAGAGTSIYQATQSPEKPPDLPQSPTMTDAQTTAKADVEQRRRAVAKSKTVYTSPLGLGEQANISRKTLLGQ